MSAESIAALGTAVVALVQLLKWAGIPDKIGPIVVLGISAIGVAVFAWSEGDFIREDVPAYIAAWIVTATSAAGVFGFTRAAANAVISGTPPPNNGAGSERVQKPDEADAAQENTYLARTGARVRRSFQKPTAPPPAVTRRAPQADETPPGVG